MWNWVQFTTQSGSWRPTAETAIVTSLTPWLGFIMAKLLIYLLIHSSDTATQKWILASNTRERN